MSYHHSRCASLQYKMYVINVLMTLSPVIDDSYHAIDTLHITSQTVQEPTNALIQVWEETPPGDHPSSHQEYVQTMHRVQIGTWRSYTHDFEYNSVSSPQWVEDFGFHYSFLHYFVVSELHYVRNETDQQQCFIREDLE